MINDTPISDSTPHNVADLGMLCRRLERQLNAANERIKRLEEMYEGEIGENEQFLGSNLQGLLTRELNWSKDRIKRLEEALESIREYWNRDNNNRALVDACWYAIDTASEALEAKEAKL
jgi:predicted  nucleic acid-binding Zn-ribbon protein